MKALLAVRSKLGLRRFTQITLTITATIRTSKLLELQDDGELLESFYGNVDSMLVYEVKQKDVR